MTQFAIGEKALLTATPMDVIVAGGFFELGIIAPHLGTTVTVAAGPRPYHPQRPFAVYEVVSQDGGLIMIVTPGFLQKLPPEPPKEVERWTDTPAFKQLIKPLADIAGLESHPAIEKEYSQ